MRIGIFGGTFDPIHVAHLVIAERCREEAGLDEVWFMPSAVPPHKTEVQITRFEHRMEMVSLATAGSFAFRVEAIERELPPPSYTAETLSQLKSRHPEHSFSLIIGGDSLHDLPTWYQPQRVVEQANLIATPRPGWQAITREDLAAKLGIAADLVHLTIVQCPAIDISSREIRQRVRDRKTIRYLVPRAVEVFIQDRKLYL